MARPERYFIGPNVRSKLTDVFARMDEISLGREGGGEIPVRLQDMRRPGGGGGGATLSVRLGQFTGSWYNEPGTSGADNVKLVKLYVQPSDSGGANDWVPELDANGDEVIAVTLNLFSYIPTRSGNDSYMWCAVLPISTASGEYWTGSYDFVNGQDVPVMRPYTNLWLLLAAEC